VVDDGRMVCVWDWDYHDYDYYYWLCMCTLMDCLHLALYIVLYYIYIRGRFKTDRGGGVFWGFGGFGMGERGMYAVCVGVISLVDNRVTLVS